MNKTQFTNRWSNMNLTQQELDRKWRLQLEAQEQELMMAERAVYLASINPMNELHVGAFGGGALTPPVPPVPGSPLTILQYVAPMGATVVWGDDNATTFTLDPTLPNYSYTIDTSFMPLLYFPAGPPPTPSAFIGVTIGNTVIDIGAAAFSNCFLLASVTFSPTSVLTTINALAFSDSPNLISIEIPASVTSIASDAFLNSGLTTVTIANGQLLGIPSPASGVSFFGATVNTILP